MSHTEANEAVIRRHATTYVYRLLALVFLRQVSSLSNLRGKVKNVTETRLWVRVFFSFLSAPGNH